MYGWYVSFENIESQDAHYNKSSLQFLFLIEIVISVC